MSDKLILNEAEAQTQLWQKIKAHFESRLEGCRRKNDNDADPIETAKMRGRILEIKSFLALDKPPPSITKVDEQSPTFE
jgi:hypothetical protein